MEDALKLLLTYGPGGLIAGLVVLGILVPRSFYDREVKRGDDATATASKNADALTGVSSALSIVASSNKTLSDEVAATKQELRELRDEFKVFIRLNGGTS